MVFFSVNSTQGVLAGYAIISFEQQNGANNYEDIAEEINSH